MGDLTRYPTIRNSQVLEDGGASRDRTDDLIVANDALSQLSYSPVSGWIDGSVILSVFRSVHQVGVSWHGAPAAAGLWLRWANRQSLRTQSSF